METDYVYNIDKYTIGFCRGGKDETSLIVSAINDDKILILGNAHGEFAECINLLIKENKQLKEQLKQKEYIIDKLKNQPTTYLTKYLDRFGFVETKTLNELIEELERSDN